MELLNTNVETATTGDAFACVGSGMWTREQFEEWVANKCYESYGDGRDDERETYEMDK